MLSPLALSDMDNTMKDDDPMPSREYLRKPRGRGYSFKMLTPPPLIGKENPRTRKPYGETIHEGLGTRDVRKAAKLRDILLGQIRGEEDALNKASPIRGSIDSAKAWAAAKRDGLIQPRDYETEVYDEKRGKHVRITATETVEDDLMLDEAEDLSEAQGDVVASQWLRVAKGEALFFKEAIDAYIDSADNLAKSTRNDLKTEGRRFLDFAGKDVTVQQVNKKLAYRHINEYLKSLKTAKAPNGLAKATIERSKTLLSGMWRWLIESRNLPDGAVNPWHDFKVMASKSQPKMRQIYTPAQWRTLIAAIPAGKALGDALRIALATGFRISEITNRVAGDVGPDLQRLFIPVGKTSSARRSGFLFGEPWEIVLRRSKGGGDLFAEVPIAPKSGERTSISNKFSRVRPQILGEDTNGSLDFHAIRTTFRTIAHRAGIDELTINELGGWSQPKTNNQPYLRFHNPDLRRAAWTITEKLAAEGYIDLPDKPTDI
jgi:integrase